MTLDVTALNVGHLTAQRAWRYRSSQDECFSGQFIVIIHSFWKLI